MSSTFLGELYRRNRLLTLVGWLHVLLFLATAVGYLTDDRIVMGANTWIKPMKFMLSLAVYLWTIAWFSRYISRPRWAIRTISIIIAVVLLIESACILLQAARATTSHYKVATDFDAAIFRTMGIMIAIDMLMSLVILFRLIKPVVRLPPSYLWGIRSGFMLFLAGGAIGAVMIVNNAHTVGAPDGGPGLPFLGWSTVGGDLRIAHGMALHALQILPLWGYALSRWARLSSNPARLAAFAAGALVYAGGVFLLYSRAMAGHPFI
jgi:hypothetical protein